MRSGLSAITAVLFAVSTVTAETNVGCDIIGAAVSPLDRRGARRHVPPKHLISDTAGGIHTVLNAHLKNRDVPLRDCAAFTIAELNTALRKMWCHLSPELDRIYQTRAGGKADKRARRHRHLHEYEAEWASEGGGAAVHEGKCAELLMLWAHHIPHKGREALRMEPSFVLPTLPQYNANHAAAKATYAAQTTCVTGHNNTGKETDHTWPHWPEEVHYNATFYGQYPFWACNGPTSFAGSAGAAWWSQSKASEKFYHSSCGLAGCGASDGAPCYHLFVGAQPSPKSWIYTADGSFCCNSMPSSGLGRGVGFPPGGSQVLSAPQADFMDTFSLQGVVNHKGPYGPSNGKVKNYTLIEDPTQVVSDFFYLTDMDDKPVAQGEGALSPSNAASAGRGKVVFHYYDTKSFVSTTLDDSVFAVPDICKTTTKTCAFP